MSLTYTTERQFAIAAVRRACKATTAVFNRLVKNETLTKDDKSPVTVGDYAAQAVISSMLHRAFPADPIIGEEDAAELRAESGKELRERIVQLANEALIADLELGDVEDWGIGPRQEHSTESLLDAIDKGNYEGGRDGRMWTIDPIDGTKGFLRGEQYAICLSLIENSQVQLGVIGCPNLPVDPRDPSSAHGCIFVAVRGHGAEQLTISGGRPTPLAIPETPPSELQFLESVEAAHSSHSLSGKVAEILEVTRPPIRYDSQAKYGCLSRGEGGVYIRLPTGVGYTEKIWDHAPGSLLVEEAGGIITDSRGLPLDFGLGRTLGENHGVVAAGKQTHSRVIEALRRATTAVDEKAKA
ncbi:3(2),5-bisphosphate nucleotidase HAL2 [Pluteus cervinus]|uniref:3(2),5-bisphosphate nucleotidase HAL2 n=1 Tax=Pluteus cervinus TaxID=181527 RepID=A0ACD3AAJ1_9AGAR|nr:3(2),5-bisphosphate nucleotidase HAL2 [Pluteus cervinus]